MTFGTLKNSPLFVFVLGFLTLALTGCPITQPQDMPADEFKVTEPVTKARFYLYVPSEYDPARKWPLVVTFHGTPGYDKARSQTKQWKALAEEHGFIVLAPELTSVQGVLPVARSIRRKQLVKDEKNVLAAMRETKRRYNIDERAVMITGFSAGGFPLYYIALRNPEKFNVLVSRMCNTDCVILKELPVTDKTRQMPVLIFYSKTGINPIYSGLNPVARDSWAAYRYLREHGCSNAKIKAVKGGHYRRVERAYRFWRSYWPQ